MKNADYSIKDLETLSRIKAHTIRIWEKRYNLLHPERTETNIRHYSDNDLRKILNVSLLVRNGYKISKVSRMSDEELKETVLTVNEKKTSQNDYIDQLLLHMANFDNISFKKLVEKVISEIGFEDAVMNVLFEFLLTVGNFWQVGSVFPAQEHFASNVIRHKIIAKIDQLEAVQTANKNILFFLPEHELHELSLLYYSYLAAKAGYGIIYLGQFVPFEDLVKLHGKLKIDFVFTAFINSIKKEDLENYLSELRELFSGIKIFVTGWQFRLHEPKLPRNVKIIKDQKDFRQYFD